MLFGAAVLVWMWRR